MEHFILAELIGKASSKLHAPLNDIESLNRWKTEMFDLVEQISQLKFFSPSPSIDRQDNRSLDPQDWTLAKNIAHRVVDVTIDSIRTIRDHLVWEPIPNEVRSFIDNEPLPEQGQNISDVCEDAFKYIFPYTRGNTHPRFWGWAMGEGTFGGILSNVIMAGMNINAGGCTHSAVLVERKVINWMRDLFGFPKSDNAGIIVNGTSMATVVCMATARRRFLSNVRQDGIVNGPQLIVYASSEVHMCIKKALELLGFGSKALHLIPTDDRFAIKIDELKLKIEDDRKNGLIPFCLIGNAGTVNTGSFDNLVELASIAREENMWFHVDGAFGSLIILDPERRYLVKGIEQADSLAFDFHKWLHCPYDAGCVLVRDGNDLLSTFSVHQSYLADTERGCAGDKPWFCDLGTDLSRSFRALKIWFTLKEHGLLKLGQKIADNCEQAQYLASLLEKYSHFITIIRPVITNIVNFRVEPENFDKLSVEDIDTFNNELLSDLQMSGIAVASTTRIYNRLYIRVCIISHRSILQDFDMFVDHVIYLYHSRIENMKRSN